MDYRAERSAILATVASARADAARKREELAAARAAAARIAREAEFARANARRLGAEATARIAELRDQRDREIRRLSAEGQAESAIALSVGSHRSTVFEVLRPDKRARYGERRRQYWRRRHP